MSSHDPLRKAPCFFSIRLVILCILSSLFNPVYAIPPPETLAMFGGSLVYPGLIIIGVLTVLLKYIWVKTKLYLVWRLHLAKIFCCLLLVAIILKVPLFSESWVQNHPVSIQTIQNWQQSTDKPVFIDLRYKQSYDKAHLLGAINFPFGAGLDNYLRNNPGKKIILYCELGLSSSTLLRLEMDTTLLKQALQENRLFYIPGGLHQWMSLGKNAPVPVIVTIPSKYANHLLKTPNFREINVSDHPVLSNSVISDYKKIHATPVIPIINSKRLHDTIGLQLSRLNITPMYFTTPTKDEAYPLNKLLLVIFSLFATLMTFRYKELFHSLFDEPSRAYQWINLPISITMTIVVIQLGLFNLPMPFDLYLYSLTTDLPISLPSLLSIYLFFGFVFLIHLVYPATNRLNVLKLTLSHVFAPTQYFRFYKRPTWKQVLIVSGIVYSLYVLSYSIGGLILLSIFLVIPLIVDVLLYGFVRQFKDGSTQILNVLKRAGYACDPNKDKQSFIQVNTLNEFALARITIKKEDKSANFGLFSGRNLDDPGDHSSTKPALFLMIRQLLLFFQQDIELSFDHEWTIISLKLYHNHLNSSEVNRHILLKHHQLVPDEINEKRFTSTTFQDVFANPNPLVLDILRLRWDKKGGCIKALHKLGLLIKYNETTKEQLTAFSNQIYLDTAFEKMIFSTNKLHRMIRKKVLDLTFHLATESILQDYYTLILPRTEIRLTRLADYLQKPLSLRRLKRIITRALATLHNESAMWQSYSSLLHQQTFNQLQNKAKKIPCDVSDLINNSPQSLKLASYYELSVEPSKKTDHFTHDRTVFFRTEHVRTCMRELQLKEWQLISSLLERLREQLRLPLSLVYLIKNDFSSLPKEHTKLMALINYRYEAWKTQNQWSFPETFSLEDMEQPSLNATLEQDSPSNEAQAIRVAGSQSIITGHAVLFNDHLVMSRLPRDSILIANNLLPEQIIACQHINGIILKKGGYLSHASIIAREKNIPLIVQFKGLEIKDHDNLLIESGNQVTILNHKILEWTFVEDVTTMSAIGNKAKRLGMLSQNGFNIPKTIVLNHQSIEKIVSLQAKHESTDRLWPAYYEELKQLFNLLTHKKSSIIVRSSTNIEDSSQFSYAGLFYSQPHITTMDALIAAICTSWQAMVNHLAIIKQYSGERQFVLNLILQPYIKGQFGGVLFTKSSIPGLMQVEIAPGGVEGVTEGNAELTSLYVDEKGQSTHAIGDKNSLSQLEYQTLYHLGHQIETLCGKPQDIEWIFSDKQFYIIQSRDISESPIISNQKILIPY